MLIFYLHSADPPKRQMKLKQIFKNYYPYMMMTANKYLSDRRDMEDVVQSAMLALIERYDTLDFSDKRKTKNLCSIIVKNKAIDFLKERYKRMESTDYEPIDPSSGETPDSIIISNEDFEKIVDTITSMDEKYRDILYLKYINGMNLHEIADILSLPYDTVKSRLKNGREIIRRILRKEFSI